MILYYGAFVRFPGGASELTLDVSLGSHTHTHTSEEKHRSSKYQTLMVDSCLEPVSVPANLKLTISIFF